MNIQLVAKGNKIPQNAKEYATEKAEKLEKFYRLQKVEIIMSPEGEKYSVDIIAHSDGSGTIVGKALAEDWFAAVDQSTDKTERQLRKLKEKVKSHRIKKYRPEGDEGSSHIGTL